MRTSSFNSKGFGIIGVLLVIVVLAVIAGGGAYVYHKDHKTKSNSSSKGSTQTSSSTTSSTTNPYAGWKSYTSSVAGYTIKYPSKWTIRTTSGNYESTYITSPDNFEIQLDSFTKSSSYGASTLAANPTGACGATCLASNTVATFNAPQAGSLAIDAQTQGAGGGSTSVLGLYTSAASAYIASPVKANTYTTVSGSFQRQNSQTLAQFTASSSTQTAEQIYKSLTF